MKYLYLKLDKGNRLADYWLQQEGERNVFGRPAVAIYFGKITSEECRSFIKLDKKDSKDVKRIINKSKDKYHPSYIDFKYQIKPFFETGDSRDAKFITIIPQRSLMYIYEPDSQVFDLPKDKYEKYDKHMRELKSGQTTDITYPKIMFVKNIKQCIEFPDILATLPCNQYLIRGTCREIDPDQNWGAIQAIKYCLGEKIEVYNDERRLRLLGWHQLETLVFLILLNAGVHPSAWRGGGLPQIDITAKNYKNEVIKIGRDPQIIFEPYDKKTFQIKRGIVKKPVKNVDYTVAINYEGKKNVKIITSEWLFDLIDSQPQTKNWFEKSLDWSFKCN